MTLSLFTSTSQRSINDCGNCTTLLPTGITNVNGQVCRVLLDHTSDKSFVTEQFAKQSKAQIKNENNYYKGLSGEICKATKAALLHTSIGGKDICLTAALTPEIGQLRAVKSVPYQNWNYIKNRKALLLDSYPRPACNVDVMLGQDVTPFIIRNKISKGSIAAEFTNAGTILLQGIIPKRDNAQCQSHSFMTFQPESHEDALANLFSLENVGIEAPQDTGMTSQEEQALKKFNDQTTYDETTKTYTCGILWKDDRPQFEGSRAAAISRLLQQERKFAKDEDYHKFYQKSMQGYFSRNDVYHIPDSELGDDNDCYYLPHSAVWKKGQEHLEPRIVFDGSANDANGHDPNSYILACPNNTLLLVAILILFRLEEIGISSDISKMYMSLLLREEDQRYARFVWRSDSSKKISTYAFRKTPWGLADSSFKCIQVLRRHATLYEETQPEIVKMITKNFYVDDLLASLPTEKATPQLISKLIEIVSEAGYKLRKFVCSAPELIAHLPKNLRLQETENVNLVAAVTGIKALGVQWEHSKDIFLFPHAETLIEKAKATEAITKRVISSYAGRIFDPLGLVLPMTVAGKVLLQQAWKELGHWDSPVSSNLTKEFRLWMEQLRKLDMFICPRYVKRKGKIAVSTELITFGDAAPQAASAICYLHTEYDDGEHHVQLVFAKSKVAPHTKSTKEKCPETGKPLRKSLSLPRLELLAATLAVRVANFVESLLEKPVKKTFLSDSSITLYWIHSKDPSRLKTWAKNRVQEILQGSSTENWYHVPGTANSADLATRKEACQTLTKTDVEHWFHGPTHWDQWAQFLDGKRQPFLSQFSMEELRANRLKDICEEETTPKLTMVTVSEKRPWWAPLKPKLAMLLERCSTFEKLLRVTCLLIRVTCPEKDARKDKTDQTIRLPELRCARRIWFQYAQLDARDEWKNWPHTYFDEETKLWRLKGRLDKMPLPFDYRHQVCLPGKHRLTKLFVIYLHVVHCHASAERTLQNLRLTAWLMPSGGLRRIQNILKKEPCCRRVSAKAAAAEMGDLPPERLTAETVFQHVGIDTAGPLPVWSKPPSKRSPSQVDLGDYLSRKKKRSIKEQLDDGSVQCVHFMLVTCMSTRMICIEPLKDLSADTMYQTMAKVFNRRGWPAKITSDNHKTFVQLSKVPAISSRTDWSFIPDRSPHWGGFYERCIGLLKQTLRKILRGGTVTFDEFAYLLSEAERSVNDRPLARNLDDPHEDARITPSMLVLGRPLKPEPSERDAPPEPAQLSSNKDVQIRVRQHKALRQQFWRRWRTQYMLSLQEYGRVFDTTSPTRLKPDDVVLVMDPNTKRNHWKLGRIISVNEGRKKPHDTAGQIRSALIQTSAGEIRRSAHLLAPMEVEVNPHTDG